MNLKLKRALVDSARCVKQLVTYHSMHGLITCITNMAV